MHHLVKRRHPCSGRTPEISDDKLLIGDVSGRKFASRREVKIREGKGREGKGREGKGREGSYRPWTTISAPQTNVTELKILNPAMILSSNVGQIPHRAFMFTQIPIPLLITNPESCSEIPPNPASLEYSSVVDNLSLEYSYIWPLNCQKNKRKWGFQKTITFREEVWENAPVFCEGYLRSIHKIRTLWGGRGTVRPKACPLYKIHLFVLSKKRTKWKFWPPYARK